MPHSKQVQRKREVPSFFPSQRLPKGEFRKTDEEPLAVDQSTRQDQPQHFKVDRSKNWSEESPQEQEKTQRG